MRKIAAILSVLMAFSLTAWAQDKETQKMIYIEFADSRQEGMDLKLTLPISFLQSFKPQIQEILREVEKEQDAINFREIWQSIRDAGPNDFVQVNSEEGDVQVSTSQTHLEVNLDNPDEGKFHITLPLALGDALLGEQTDLNFDAMLEALLSMEGQDLVKVQSEHINGFIRIQ